MRKILSNKITFFLVISFLFLSLRVINLPTAVNFGSDAARDFLVTWNMYQTHHPVLIGPPSEYSFNGRQFFFGPAPYYLILPALLIGHWDPLAVSYFLILLNLVVLLFTLNVLNKKSKFFFAIFGIFSPSLVWYSQSYWNPYFMLPVSTLLLAFLVKSKDRKRLWFEFLLIGFLFGLGLQFHYSFIFAIIISFIWLFKNNKTLQNFGFLIAGFIIGFFPLILFEIRNHFYNLNTMILVFTHPSSGTSLIVNQFYLISLLPFFFYFLSSLFITIRRASYLITVIFFGGYILWSLVAIFTPHMYPLSYPEAKMITKKIVQDNPKNFNVADQLTRDNRATPIRYLLTIRGVVPQGILDYPNASILYVYSKQPLPSLLKNPVWEIGSFLPYKSVSTTTLSSQIFLYKLQK